MYATQGVVLKKTAAGEANALITLYTQEYGKIQVFAQGVRKEKAKLRGHVEPLSLGFFQFVSGTYGERLTYAAMVRSWMGIRNDFQKYGVACYMLAVVDAHCLDGEKDNGIWTVLVDHLVALEDGDFPSLLCFLSSFETSLLACLGYQGVGKMSHLESTIARPFSIVYNGEGV